jgi:hypothetical protein
MADWQLIGRSSKAAPAATSLISTGPAARLHIVHIGNSSNDLWHGTMPVPPEFPTALTFSNVGKRSATLSWQDNSSIEEKFLIYRSLYSTHSFYLVGTKTIGCLPAGSSRPVYSYDDYGLSPGHTYYYKVYAQNFGGTSYGIIKSVTTLPPEHPARPSDVHITGETSTSVSIAWKDNANNEDGFIIDWGIGSKTLAQPNLASYTVTGLRPDVHYCFTVKSYNEDGALSNDSETACTTTDPAPATCSNIVTQVCPGDIFPLPPNSVITGFTSGTCYNQLSCNYIVRDLTNCPLNTEVEITNAPSGTFIMPYGWQQITSPVQQSQYCNGLKLSYKTIFIRHVANFTGEPKKQNADMQITADNAKSAGNLNAYLEQNAPNPFNNSTTIRYHIPASASNAQIIVINAVGRMVKTFTVINKGAGSITINGSELAAGNYYYTLIVDGKKADSRQMILNK